MIKYDVIPCARSDVSDFIKTWHYSKSINGLHTSYCFKLMDGNSIVGAMLFGKLGMANVWKKYGKKESDVIELNRLCCIDNTPKNTESYFIGRCIKWLKKNTDVKKIVSYADPEYNHIGTIYKATNFRLVGMTSQGRVIIHNGKKYHDKTLRTKYKGELKPYAQRLKIAMENGEAYYKKTEGKYIFIYDLKDTW
jgi:hypothetical protein